MGDNGFLLPEGVELGGVEGLVSLGGGGLTSLGEVESEGLKGMDGVEKSG